MKGIQWIVLVVVALILFMGVLAINPAPASAMQDVGLSEGVMLTTFIEPGVLVPSADLTNGTIASISIEASLEASQETTLTTSSWRTLLTTKNLVALSFAIVFLICLSVIVLAVRFTSRPAAHLLTYKSAC